MGAMGQYDFFWKLLLVGDSGVGKTDLLSRFTTNEFNAYSKPTIGVDFRFRNVQIQGKTVVAQIWDTAGQERYPVITNGFYRGAVGALVMYDIANHKTFENLDKWIRELKEKADNCVCIMIVGNKTDLTRRMVPTEQGRSLAEKYGLPFMEISALDSSDVGEAFDKLLVDIFKIQTESEKSDSICSSRIVLQEKKGQQNQASHCGC